MSAVELVRQIDIRGNYHCLSTEPVETAISGCRRHVGEICAILGYYTASCGSSVPTFRDNVSVPSSRVKKSKKMGPIRCPETSVNSYHTTLCKILEELRSQLKLCGQNSGLKRWHYDYHHPLNCLVRISAPDGNNRRRVDLKSSSRAWTQEMRWFLV
jgi:hypothetical protein